MYFKIDNKGFNRTILVFSSINTLKGNFRFYRALGNIDANIVYLNCPNNSWYLNGIPSLGDSLIESRKNLMLILKKEFFNNEFYAFGSSMGGAGLITMLPDFELSNAFAFCPEIDLFQSRSFSEKYYGEQTKSKIDLWEELGRIQNLKLFYGEECPQDLMQIYKIKKEKDINIPMTTFANEGHGVIEAIYFTEGISGIIDALLTNKQLQPQIIKKGHIQGSSIACWLIAKASLAEKQEKMRIYQKLKEIIAITPINKSYYSQLLYAQSMLTNDKDEKIALLSRALIFAQDSLKIAKAYYNLLGDNNASALFKQSWIKKFGSNYAKQKRAKSILDQF